jgi:hypothetical protein
LHKLPALCILLVQLTYNLSQLRAPIVDILGPLMSHTSGNLSG